MRIIWAALTAMAALACAALAPVAPRVEYTFTPIFSDGALQAVQVDLEFRGLVSGETNLILPSEWGGQSNLFHTIEGLEAISGATMQETDSPSRRVLTHRPAARIHVRYRIIQDWQGEPMAERGNPYRPIVRPSYFHFIGDTALVVPEIDGLSPVIVRTRNMPRGWTFASDLQHPGIVIARVASSISVGGDFRVVQARSDPRMRVAIRGQWSFTDAAFTDQVATIIAGQRRFWGDDPSPFLVTVIQLSQNDPGWISIGGTGLGDAFAFFGTPNGDPRTIARTLAHETQHTWIPGEIGGMPQTNEAADYWFSEGFTDFYTYRLMVRDGLWTPADFAAELNAMLSEYAHSPVRTAPNARILADYWTDHDVQRLPYQRGMLLAAIWDARLRAAGSRDLDDVMHEMRAQAGSPEKAAEMFPRVAEGMGLDISPELAANVERGEAVLLPENVFAPCGRVTTRTTPAFHRGFDIAATQANNNVITGVDPSMPAYAAGLRNGMTLVRRAAGVIGDSTQEIAYVVRDGETERTIRYMPRGPGEITQQTFELEPNLAGERLAACQRVLGGA